LCETPVLTTGEKKKAFEDWWCDPLSVFLRRWGFCIAVTAEVHYLTICIQRATCISGYAATETRIQTMRMLNSRLARFKNHILLKQHWKSVRENMSELLGFLANHMWSASYTDRYLSRVFKARMQSI